MLYLCTTLYWCKAVHVRIYGAFFTTTRYTLVSEMDLQDVMRSGRFFMSTFNDELEGKKQVGETKKQLGLATISKY